MKWKATESQTQERSVHWFDMFYWKLSQLLFHIPNGGKRNLLEARKFKRMGVRAGVSDLFLSVANKGYSGLYIEMKSEGQYQSKEQKRFQASVEAEGYCYRVCYTVEQFIGIIQWYLDGHKFYRPLMNQQKLESMSRHRTP